MEEFSWQTEFKEFTHEDVNFVKKLEINEDKGDSCLVTLITLEDQEYKIKFEITKGATILEPQDLERSRFDDMNQLLNALSPEYRKSFQMALFAKLTSCNEE